MDFDSEINSQEGHRPDPLFNSIMNAMNSMKEATADKIYHKIQREGETNYSRPQVDRALASALKYGIFDVKNNRYRVRDDVLDDEDTVYWKLQKKREQTPFPTQEDIHERQFGPKLDPEKDNQRFRKMGSKETPECPQCGRTKKPSEELKPKRARKTRNHKIPKRKRRKPSNKLPTKNVPEESNSESQSTLKKTAKRRKQYESVSNDRRTKMRKVTGAKMNQASLLDPKFDSFKRATERQKIENTMHDKSKYDSSDSEIDSLSAPSDDEQSFISYRKCDTTFGNKNYAMVSECDEVDSPNKTIMQGKRSIVSESESERSEITSVSDDGQSQSRPNEEFFENLPCTSRNTGSKEVDTNQYLSSREIYGKQYERAPANQCDRKSDWMGCSDEPQGTIIQSCNVLTIEPMDSFVFKSPEQASYIS